MTFDINGPQFDASGLPERPPAIDFLVELTKDWEPHVKPDLYDLETMVIDSKLLNCGFYMEVGRPDTLCVKSAVPYGMLLVFQGANSATYRWS